MKHNLCININFKVHIKVINVISCVIYHLILSLPNETFKSFSIIQLNLLFNKSKPGIKYKLVP